MTIMNRIKARTHAWRSEGSATPEVIDEVLEFVAAIEAAMREPVAEVVGDGYGWEIRWFWLDFMLPEGTKLFALPPDAGGEIERLKVDVEYLQKLAALAGKEGK